MFQNQFIALGLCFAPMLIYLEAHQLSGEKLTTVKDTYAGRGHKLSIQTARSRLECNKRCTNTELCNAVNFGNRTCELLTLSDDYEDHLQSRPGWTLSYKKNTCLSKPCENGGSCIERIGGYTCTCAAGYEGVNCQDEINECLSSPCLNGGSCEDAVAGYTCTCDGGYEGVNCQDEINECLSSPCLNGGSCEDAVAGYTCTCDGGYEGVNCQDEIDECLSSPCLNGGSCEDALAGYTCTCAGGYGGVNCQDEINECLSSPCLNRGSCEDAVAGYTCTCAGGYGGVNCQDSIEVVCRGGVTPLATVTVSSVYSLSDDESNICPETHWWHAAESDTTPWVNIVLPSAATIIKVKVGSNCLSYEFLAALNGSLTLIDTFTHLTDQSYFSTSSTRTLSSPITTQHVRFEILSIRRTTHFEVGLME